MTESSLMTVPEQAQALPATQGTPASSAVAPAPVSPARLTPAASAMRPPSGNLPGLGSLAAGVNAVLAKTAAVPKGVTGGSTNDIENNFFRGLLYGETDSWKTTTAANFGGPKHTFIVLTRSEEQLRPVQNQGFRYIKVVDAAGLEWALRYPEQAADHAGFSEWKDDPDRVLQVDDMSEGANFLVEENSTTDEGKARNNMQVYKGVNEDWRELLASMKRKRMHLIFTALAKITANPITNEETIAPDLPKGMNTLLTAELEYTFFMRKNTQRMLTRMSFLNYTKMNEKMKVETYKREIFAKRKLPLELVDVVPPVIAMEEPKDLRALWNRISEATAKAKTGAKK